MSAADAGTPFEYELCLSFAGEDRPYVDQVAQALRERGIRFFKDSDEQALLWGKDLYTHLDEVYRKQARHCVVFISSHYVRKPWTRHESRSAQARALFDSGYILPARFDDSELPGLLPTVSTVDLRHTTPVQLAELIATRLGMSPRAAIFIDGDWLFGSRIDTTRLVTRLRDEFGADACIALQTSSTLVSRPTQQQFEEWRSLGCEIAVPDGNAKPALEQDVSFDVWLALRIARLPAHFHTVVVVSSDGDVGPWLARARAGNRTAVSIGRSDAMQRRLREAADRFIDLDAWVAAR